MNLEEILHCLKDEAKRNSLIYKLQQAGENSFEFQALRKIVENFNLNKPLPGSSQITILKHTFQFLTARECFKSVSSVCKTWNFAVETSRFNEFVPEVVFLQTESQIKKNLSYFKRLNYLYSETKVEQNQALLQAARNLKYIELRTQTDTPPSCFYPFMTELVTNSTASLEELSLPNFVLPNPYPDFLKLQTLHVQIHEMSVEQFDNALNKVISVSPNLQFVLRKLKPGRLSDHIARHYQKQCFLGIWPPLSIDTPNLVPLKMYCKTFYNSNNLNTNFDWTFAFNLNSLILDFVYPSTFQWDNFESSLDCLPNLKFLCLAQGPGQQVATFLNSKSDYLNNRKIQILNMNEYFDHCKKCLRSIPEWSLNFDRF